MEKATDSKNELYKKPFLLNQIVKYLQDYEENEKNGLPTDPKGNGNPKGLTGATNNQFYRALEVVNGLMFGGLSLENDPLLLALLSDVFISVCNQYNKTPSLEGFGYISGISADILRSWSADAKTDDKKTTLNDCINKLYIYYNKLFNIKDLDQPIYFNNINLINNNNIYDFNNNNIDLVQGFGMLATATSGKIYNKLLLARENAIKNHMIDSKQQLGAVAVVNREFAWSADRIGQEERARALTLADLPKLSSYVNSSKTIETTEPQEMP